MGVKISQLPAVSSLTGTEIFPVVQSGVTSEASINQIASSIVPYTQGGTGSVARTVQSKLQESVSVLDFGADPTGVASSTAAIVAAITALSTSGGVVFFPAGVYLHTGFTLVDGVSIEGVGAGTAPNSTSYKGTVLKNTSNTNSITISGGNVRNCRIRNMRITSTGSALSGINANGWGNLDALTGVMIDTHVTGGVTLVNCWDLSISDCWFANNTGYGLQVGSASNNCRVEKTMLFQNGTDGIQVSAAFTVTIDKCDFESNYNHQIHLITGSNRGINILNNYFEYLQNGTTYSGIRVDASVADTVKIDGNFVDMSNATAILPVTFLDVETGNSRVVMDNLSFINGATPQYATFVNFKSGCNFCRAKVALTTNPIVNASTSSRVWFEDDNEIGVAANDGTTQTFTAAAWNAFAFPTIQMDPKGEWNTSTNTFTPKDFGMYEITFGVAVAMTAGDTFDVRVYDTTGAYEYSRILERNTTTTTSSLFGSFREKLGPSNTIQLQVYPSAARSTNPGGQDYSWIRIRRVM